MVALISPTWLLRRTSTSSRPLRIRARVVFTQAGHNESVVRGQPSPGVVFSQLLRSGAEAQAGWNEEAGPRRTAAARITVHPSCAARVTTASNAFVKIMNQSLSVYGSS